MPRSRDAQGFYLAAERFADECLRSGGSLFTPGQEIWTAVPVTELYERFVENPDEAKDVDFTAKLVGQLEGAPAAVYQLAAEMLYILLVPQHYDAATRRKQVDTVLAASPEPVELPDDLATAFEGGIASYGAALTRRFDQYVFLCEFVRAWVPSGPEERERLLSDASVFRDFVLQLPRKGASSQVEALLHMVFPDDFEPIVSVDVKGKIARAFADYSAEPSSAPIDQQLASIRAALEEEVGAGFDFYDDELRAVWDGAASTGRRAWIVRGERAYGANLVPRWIEEGFVSMGAADEGRIEPGMTVKEIIDLVQQARPEMTRQQLRGGATSGRYFASEISVGDYVLTRDGESVYIGRVTSDQEFVRDDQPGTARRRQVEWLNREEPLVWADLPKSLRERATNPNTVWELKGQVDVIQGLIGEEEDTADALWEPFLHWAQRLYEHESFDEEERDYKLVVGENMRLARQALLDGAEDWLPKLRRAFSSRNNLTSFYAHGRFLDWCSEDQHAGAAFLRDIWTQEAFDPATVSRLVTSWPDTPNSGTGNRLAILSVLLMGVDPLQHPPYKTMWVDKALGLLGLPTRGTAPIDEQVELEPEDVAGMLGVSGLSVRSFMRKEFPRAPEAKGTRYGPLPREQVDAIFEHFGRPSADSNEDAGRRYGSFLALLDEIVDRMRSRGTELRDRLDAQSLAWWITSAEPPVDWSEEEKEAFLMYQGQGVGPGSSEAPGELEALADELLLDPVEWLEDVVRLLEQKRQIIFYGPPGTGKTYVAQKLALYLAGNEEVRVRIVQFHPSYAYEDFVEGYRPTLEDGAAGFRLHDGPLKKLAADAGDDPDNIYVLVIDEINRGNVAKVFGELYFLLEYRDHELNLQYSDRPFKLPENLWVIGTMNTADRTIALLDTALRRRFHFVPFFPTKEPISGLLRRWLAREEKDDLLWLADVLDRANVMLEDEHAALGPSYFMVDELDEDWIETIWRHSILPTIEERYFTDAQRARSFELSALRDGAVPGAPGEATEPNEEDASGVPEGA